MTRSRLRAPMAVAVALFAILTVPGTAAAADPPQTCGFYTVHKSQSSVSFAYYRNCSYLNVHHIKIDVVLDTDRKMCVARKHNQYLGEYGSDFGQIRGAKHDYDC